MKPLKEKISITIDGDILQIAKVKAEEDDRSLSQYINVVLKEHLKKARRKPEDELPTEKTGQKEMEKTG